ncbi:hypothetical protein C8R44DRAFT_895379 [Mycena epipterygia]|nr:hypothetical protein C8R44DRAFT_895379 [Mycena epipterygia]
MDSMIDKEPTETDTNAVSSSEGTQHPIDLIGAPFTVIESDPGVFTSLARRLGIRGLEVVELYDIEPYAVDELSPRGLIFCFLWRKDVHRPRDFADPAAERVWFANQLSSDACASLALLNIVFNCGLEVEIGAELGMFKSDTEKMTPVMKGLAISSSPFIQEAHRAFARPADLRAALNAIAASTLDKSEQRNEPKARTPAKRGRGSKVASGSKTRAAAKPKPKQEETITESAEAYHFIGYVPAYGKVWELDGLKSGPLEVGELAGGKLDAGQKNWMDVVRPAIRSKMRKYGGAEGGDNIRFSLLAVVDGLYEKASDDLEFLKREKGSIERRMKSGWESLVDGGLLEQAKVAFDYPVGKPGLGRTYSADFGARRMARDLEILNMPESVLVSAWEQCVKDAGRAHMAVEDEVAKATRENTEFLKRTHDYEPFLKEIVSCLEKEGLLDGLLDGGKKTGKKRAKAS